MAARALMWFRADLRTTDNPALCRALADASDGVVAVFVISPEQWQRHDWGANRIGMVLRCLDQLAQRLAALNIPLRIIEAPLFAHVPDRLLALAGQVQARSLYFNSEYEINEMRRDMAVHEAMSAEGLEVNALEDQTIVPPRCIQTGEGRFYTRFTPFRNAWLKAVAERNVQPLTEPDAQRPLSIKSDPPPLELVSIDGLHRLRELWPGGQDEAAGRLERFVAQRIDGYDQQRDVPSDDATSRLSPYLATGAISARQCLAAARSANGGRIDAGKKGIVTWISELTWREFYRHMLLGFPRLSMHRPFRPATERIAWRDDREALARWQEGRTGVPIVDAAMRQLHAEGWMHNRLRMITAMYLAKHLLIDWRQGERFFMQHLVDGDLASNNGGWQWSASTGADPVPYFRIMNPTLQSKRFDPDGRFIRRHCPELAALDNRAIHEPWTLGNAALADMSYPAPHIDHPTARRRALEAFGAS